MRFAGGGQRHGLAVRTGHDEGLGHDVLDVLFAHTEIDFTNVIVFVQHKVKTGVGRILSAQSLGDLGDGLAHRPLVFLGLDIGYINIAPATLVRGVGFLPQNGPGLGIPQTGQHGVHAALKGPGGHIGTHGGCRCPVGILVTAHVQTLPTGTPDHGNGGLAGHLPVGFVGDLMVGDLQPHAGLFGHMEGLLHRFHHVIAFVAHVSGVITAVGRNGRHHPHQLVGGGVAAGGIDQTGADAKGTLFHGLCRKGLHLGDLLIGSLVTGIAHNGLAHRAVSHQGGAVDAGFSLLHCRQEICHSREGLGRGLRAAAVAAHVGGDALQNTAFGGGTVQNAVIAVGMDVDKTGCQIQSGRVHRFFGLSGHFAQGGDFAVRDGQITVVPGRAGTVNDTGIFDQKIVHTGLLTNCAAVFYPTDGRRGRCR